MRGGGGRCGGGRLLKSQQFGVGEAFDVVVVGTGIAGLVAALTASPRARVAVVTKGALEEGSTRWAQGGIAAALGADDSPDLHLADTVAAGRGLCDERAVRVLVDEGPDRVHDLARWGVRFDVAADGSFALGREAAHSRARVVHAGGDATGREVESALVRRLRESSVTVLERTHVTRLLRDDEGRCCAVEVDGAGERRVIGAGAVILASGGAGRLWRNTTNPGPATGDGVALAWDCGAEVMSMEFVQFHPTALALDGAPRFLLSEALRGEGAHVVDAAGERFLFDADPRGELAGRDVVSRAIWERLGRDGADHVYLDCRPLGAPARERFPTIAAALDDAGIDMVTQRVPIAPAAHYLIGGVRTDVDGATTLPGLFACGEAAATGVHGANRLASNSLLEGAVFGRRAARAALHDVAERPVRSAVATDSPTPRAAAPGDAAAATERMRDAMWQGCGLARDAAGLRAALTVVDEVRATAAGDALEAVALFQAATTASLVCRAALLREETRGAHRRTDFPMSSDSWHDVLVMHKERGHRLGRNA